MASKNKAVGMVVEYIVAYGLYSFSSLTDDTQERLTKAYGEGFKDQVNAQLSL